MINVKLSHPNLTTLGTLHDDCFPAKAYVGVANDVERETATLIEQFHTAAALYFEQPFFFFKFLPE